MVGGTNAEAQRRKDIRDQLSSFIAEGAQLMLMCGDTSAPIPDQAVENWGKRIGITSGRSSARHMFKE